VKEKRNYYKNKGSCCKREEKVETKTKMDSMSTKTISKLYENASSEGEQSSEEEEGAESSATEEQKTPPPSPLPIALNIKKKAVKKQTTKNKHEHSTKKLRLIKKPRKRECTREKMLKQLCRFLAESKPGCPLKINIEGV
jgi:hypothetical protein